MQQCDEIVSSAEEKHAAAAAAANPKRLTGGADALGPKLYLLLTLRA